MSNPVERLEALLERVQHNRTAPRGVPPGNGARPQPRAEAPEARAAAPQPPPAVAPVRSKPAPTPLEMALEGRVSQPGPPPASAPRKPEPVPAPPAFVSAARPEPAPSPGPRLEPGPRDGRVLADPGVPEPTKPIIQVVSKQPPASVASFGDLLKRSLSLRPR